MVDEYTWYGVATMWALALVGILIMVVVMSSEPEPSTVVDNEAAFMKLCKENGFECHILPRQ